MYTFGATFTTFTVITASPTPPALSCTGEAHGIAAIVAPGMFRAGGALRLGFVVGFSDYERLRRGIVAEIDHGFMGIQPVIVCEGGFQYYLLPAFFDGDHGCFRICSTGATFFTCPGMVPGGGASAIVYLYLHARMLTPLLPKRWETLRRVEGCAVSRQPEGF